METTKLSSKGQIILPKSVRESHHWAAGMEFVIEDTSDGIMLRPAKSFSPTRLMDVVGCTGYAGSAKTLEEMEAAIAEGASVKHAGR
ncbi:MAG: AbrB/MazE/SpoVT family DNA-binding domain-containing protein [Sulfuricellaceae bacterium]|nr:AbrB/MazE/SpoVT family DNA-binding domain-containing protein [Sulfuricellaceae bacterium]